MNFTNEKAIKGAPMPGCKVRKGEAGASPALSRNGNANLAKSDNPPFMTKTSWKESWVSAIATTADFPFRPFGRNWFNDLFP